MMNDMTALLAFWITVIVVAAVLAALRDIYDDGYGHRPLPPSHYPDPFDPADRFRTT